MTQDPLGEILAHLLREIAQQQRLERRILRQAAPLHGVLQHQLGARQQHGQFRAGQPFAVGCAARQHLAVGQAFGAPVQLAGSLERLDQPDLRGDCGRASDLGDRQRQRLQAVVLQHQLGDLVGHVDQQRVAALLRQLAGPLRGLERDLDIDLVVRAIDAGRVVDEVGVDTPAVEGELDPPRLRHAEVGAFADHLGADVLARHPQGVVGRIADLRVGLGAGADVSADAAEPQQVDRALEDRVDQAVGVEFTGIGTQRLGRLPGNLDPLHGPRKDPAALADQLLVVVGPA